MNKTELIPSNVITVSSVTIKNKHYAYKSQYTDHILCIQMVYTQPLLIWGRIGKTRNTIFEIFKNRNRQQSILSIGNKDINY